MPLSKCRRQFEGVSRLALGPHSALEFAADKFRTVSWQVSYKYLSRKRCWFGPLQVMMPEVKEESNDLVSRVGLQGICMVEFKRTAQWRASCSYRSQRSPLSSNTCSRFRPWHRCVRYADLSLPIFRGIDYPLLWSSREIRISNGPPGGVP
jgi:hypothetical protein